MNDPSTHVRIVMPIGTRRGGAEVSLLQVAERQEALPFRLSVAFLEPGDLVVTIADAGVDVLQLPGSRLRDPRGVATTVRALRRAGHHDAVDLHFGWMAKGGIFGGLAAGRGRAGWYHLGTPSGHPMDRAATAMGGSDVVVLSDSAAEAQRRLRPERRVHVVPAGVEVERLARATIGPRSARAILGLPADRPIVGIVGRLQHWKGQHVVIDAIARVVADVPDVLLLVVGGAHAQEPEYERELERQVRVRELSDTVRLTGLQTPADLWIQAMDVVVHASWEEPFGLVVVEAMTHGRPLVAADSGGPRAIVRDGRDGLLVRPGNVTGYAAAITRLLTDAQLAARVGSSARERARDFDAGGYVTALGAALATMAAEPLARRRSRPSA